ncbi:translation elongation factor-like protein [candidate division WWE3 bacterium CG_4_10_14_0_2_um_filter_42_8]|uniref:Translation elongation factor-like protein n=1 Tax=candidate division WWE3 bacterium CG_4_10_14_0_2_um_filter_42_8 TaxID=1975074 RepID=A0A2M7TBC9_UNCKA|nr:MAG: translation elongation factor-like protein [candidate division WWE3 bacterium CG_4_10_14_0_2_um_filter_42_8]
MEEKNVGFVKHVFKKISVAVLEVSDSFEIGDHLRFTSKNEGFSQIASSMEVNHQKVNIARKGDDVAIKVDRPVKKRDLVFKVMQK